MVFVWRTEDCGGWMESGLTDRKQKEQEKKKKKERLLVVVLVWQYIKNFSSLKVGENATHTHMTIH